MLVQGTHHVLAAAERAVMRMYSQKLSRAFNTWKHHTEEYLEAHRKMRHATRVWSDPRARAFRTWSYEATERRRVQQMLLRACASFRSPTQRWAMSVWQSRTASVRKLKDSGGRILRHWKSRTLSICFRHWHALVFPAVPRGPSAREQQQYWHGVRELLARPCLKKGRYSRRWRVVQLSISSAGELVYASRSSGHVKMRHVSLSWITRVEPVGATRYGLGLSAFIGVGAGACYKWRMELNTLGRQHCGTRHLIFGCESADAMHCWLDELARGRGIGGIGGVAVGGGGGVTSARSAHGASKTSSSASNARRMGLPGIDADAR
jgi:hypothetical protein